MMHAAEVVALGYRYPGPESAARLEAAIKDSLHGAVQRHMTRFVDEISALEFGKWEELHTATLDLSPQFVPYVGHVAWGENYRRGAFMAELNGVFREAGIELYGELPDHIEPVLRYLGTGAELISDLVDVLPSAVATMQETLRKAAPKNPYNHLLAATVDLAADLRPLSIGTRR